MNWWSFIAEIFEKKSEMAFDRTLVFQILFDKLLAVCFSLNIMKMSSMLKNIAL